MSFHEYSHGGLIPPGGAAINVQVLPDSETNETALNRLLLKTDHPTRSPVILNGVPTERLELAYDMSPSDHYRNVSVAQRVSGKQFLFILEYHAGDPNGAIWDKTLIDVISSVSLIPGGR